MRILITNDDGIYAEQLVPLVRWAKTLGEVTVVAPLYEQSAKSHGIEIHKPFTVQTVDLGVEGVTAYAVDSTPADCVRFAVLGQKMAFDLVLSGVNRGYNIGTDIMYSGTVAAASEASLLGIPALALSTGFDNYPNATVELPRVMDYIRDRGLLEVHSTYNINIPPCPKGVCITHQGGPYYSDAFPAVGEGLYQAEGMCVHVNGGDLTLDTDATISGYISVMPLTIHRTDVTVYDKLTK